MPKLTRRWKFLLEGNKSQSGEHTWEIGKWYTVPGEIVACERGFHCSVLATDALSYVHGSVLAEVVCKGVCVSQSDKEAWESMKVVKTYAWTKEKSVKLAIFAAEQVIELYEKEYLEDKRPRKAIEAAKAYLKDPNEKNRDAAANAAYAAYAANAAANAAAYAAANAANAAANAAYAADAFNEMRDRINAELIRLAMEE